MNTDGLQKKPRRHSLSFGSPVFMDSGLSPSACPE